MRNHLSTEEMRADKHKEPRLPTVEEHTLVELFDNKLKWLFLLLDFTQTRTQILELIEELGVLTWRINNIARRLGVS